MREIRTLTARTLAFVAVLSTLSLFAPWQAFAAEPASEPLEMIVRFRGGEVPARFLQLYSFDGSSPIRPIHGGTMHVLQADPAALAADPDVLWAEPNAEVSIAPVASSDPDSDDPEEETAGPPKTPWGIKRVGAAEVWAEGNTGRGVIVAVLDTGVEVAHPALAGRVFRNEAEIEGNGLDDDGNGFVDDVAGWDFANRDNVADDENGHGTHCAGTVAGDIVGVAPGATILPLKFIGKNGRGKLSDAIDAIHYATRMGAKVLNNSWGGQMEEYQALNEAVGAAEAAGVLFVAAAGNNGTDNSIRAFQPANIPLSNVISVAATQDRDGLAFFSNYGRTKVHVAAPGEGVKSLGRNGKYRTLDGTSMAAPHVAGIAALMLSKDPTLTPEAIRQRLMDTSDRSGVSVIARGRVNAYSATR